MGIGEAQGDNPKDNVGDKSKWQMDRNEFKEEINEKEYSASKCFQCGLCENNFEDRRAFMQHMINVHNEKEEHNETPASKFKEKKKIKKKGQHRRKYEECPYCSKQMTKDSLKVHIFTVHKDKRYLHTDIVARFACDKCDEVFLIKSQLTQHKEHRHSGSVTCGLCSKVFLNSLI